MSISDEYFDDGDEESKQLLETIKASLDKLVEEGLVTITGIEANGEWRYGATVKGRKFVNDNKHVSDIEGFEDL